MKHDIEKTAQTIPALDGFELKATLFTPAGQSASDDYRDRPIVIISSATAVPQAYYDKFASYIAARGYQSLTYDYRGIGFSRPASLKGFEARMRDWGEQDLAGVLNWAKGEHPDRPIYTIGHSGGGFAAGLAHNNHLITRQLNVATLSGHWRYMKDLEKYKVAFFMYTLLPLITRTWGYFPGWVMGNAEDMPRGVMLEWARWCRSDDFLFDDPTLKSRENFEKFKAPLRALQFSDDIWGTRRAVEHITDRFENAPGAHLVSISPKDIGATYIGHMGFFRERFSDSLWEDACAWLFEEI